MARFGDDNYGNWLKTTESLNRLRLRLRSFLENETETYHNSLRSKLRDSLREAVCQNKCDGKQWQKKVPECKVCTPWKTQILANHTARSLIYWKNCKPHLWPTEKWEVAKVYMPQGHGDHVSYDHFDIAALLNLMGHCKHFRKFVKDQPLNMVINVRNRVMHSPDLTVTQQDFQQHLEKIRDLAGLLDQYAHDLKMLPDEIDGLCVAVDGALGPSTQGPAEGQEDTPDGRLEMEQRALREKIECLTQRYDQDQEGVREELEGIWKFLRENADLREELAPQMEQLQIRVDQHEQQISVLNQRVDQLEVKVTQSPKKNPIFSTCALKNKNHVFELARSCGWDEPVFTESCEQDGYRGHLEVNGLSFAGEQVCLSKKMAHQEVAGKALPQLQALAAREHAGGGQQMERPAEPPEGSSSEGYRPGQPLVKSTPSSFYGSVTVLLSMEVESGEGRGQEVESEEGRSQEEGHSQEAESVEAAYGKLAALFGLDEAQAGQSRRDLVVEHFQRCGFPLPLELITKSPDGNFVCKLQVCGPFPFHDQEGSTRKKQAQQQAAKTALQQLCGVLKWTPSGDNYIGALKERLEALGLEPPSYDVTEREGGRVQEDGRSGPQGALVPVEEPTPVSREVSCSQTDRHQEASDTSPPRVSGEEPQPTPVSPPRVSGEEPQPTPVPPPRVSGEEPQPTPVPPPRVSGEEPQPTPVPPPRVSGEEPQPTPVPPPRVSGEEPQPTPVPPPRVSGEEPQPTPVPPPRVSGEEPQPVPVMEEPASITGGAAGSRFYGSVRVALNALSEAQEGRQHEAEAMEAAYRRLAEGFGLGDSKAGSCRTAVLRYFEKSGYPLPLEDVQKRLDGKIYCSLSLSGSFTFLDQEGSTKKKQAQQQAAKTALQQLCGVLKWTPSGDNYIGALKERLEALGLEPPSYDVTEREGGRVQEDGRSETLSGPQAVGSSTSVQPPECASASSSKEQPSAAVKAQSTSLAAAAGVSGTHSTESNPVPVHGKQAKVQLPEVEKLLVLCGLLPPVVTCEKCSMEQRFRSSVMVQLDSYTFQSPGSYRSKKEALRKAFHSLGLATGICPAGADETRSTQEVKQYFAQRALPCPKEECREKDTGFSCSLADVSCSLEYEGQGSCEAEAREAAFLEALGRLGRLFSPSGLAGGAERAEERLGALLGMAGQAAPVWALRAQQCKASVQLQFSGYTLQQRSCTNKKQARNYLSERVLKMLGVSTDVSNSGSLRNSLDEWFKRRNLPEPNFEEMKEPPGVQVSFSAPLSCSSPVWEDSWEQAERSLVQELSLRLRWSREEMSTGSL